MVLWSGALHLAVLKLNLFAQVSSPSHKRVHDGGVVAVAVLVLVSQCMCRPISESAAFLFANNLSDSTIWWLVEWKHTQYKSSNMISMLL